MDVFKIVNRPIREGPTLFRRQMFCHALLLILILLLVSACQHWVEYNTWFLMLRRSTPMHSLGSVECDRPVYQQTDHVTTTGPSASSWARSEVKKEALLWKTLC